MELVVYYERGNNRAWLQPDLQVVFGVVDPHANRYTLKVWEEGTAPDFVLEVASPSTAEHDAQYQARQYAAIGVREYWRLDPTGELTGTPLEGYRARGSRSDRVASVTGPGGAEYLRQRGAGVGPEHGAPKRPDGAGDSRSADRRGVRWTGAEVLPAAKNSRGQNECRG